MKMRRSDQPRFPLIGDERKHAERGRDAYFWNDLFEEFDVEFIFLYLQAILGAVAIRVVISCGSSDQSNDDLGSLSGLGLE